MKNRHFGGESSRILAGKARKCGRFWVFACVPNPCKQSIWRQCPPGARKQSTNKLPNRPSFAHVHGTPPRDKMGPVPGTNRPFLFNSAVKSPFCLVCPWTIVPQGPSEKCLSVFCLLVFFRPQPMDASQKVPLKEGAS